MRNLLLLSPEDYENNKPTKILDKELNKLKSFSAGFNFYFENFEYDNFHEALKKVSTLENSFLVLGELTEFGEALEETGKTGPRRKKKGEPTIQDRNGDQIVLDLDDHIIPGFDALDPEAAIQDWLAEKKIKCDVTYQITSGQKLNTEEARIRLYFECTKPLPLETRKAWSQSPDIAADGSVYTCSQPIYTASPVIEKGKDPIKDRWGFIEGSARKIRLPKLSIEEVQKYSGYIRDKGNWDFDDSELPEEVLNGSVYRRYFMPLAFHYANKLKGDREAIFHIIAGKAQAVKSREFSEENTYAYIDDALAKIKNEDSEALGDVLTSDDIEVENGEAQDTPEFPENIMETWPAPWPMLWENFKIVPRQLEEALLVPTILATNAFFLRANFVTSYNRRPNMLYLNLTPSTGNKDVNSKNVIRDLNAIFQQKGHKVNHFTGILNTESNITADSTFLQSFNEDDELFWINTEATRIFQQIKMSGSVSAVTALSDKLIEVVDGHEITGKIKAAGKVKTIQNPNAQVLFYAQPETIERYIDEDMVDSGLFGRALLSIVPDLKFEIDSYEMFKEQGGINSELDDEFIDFYNAQEFKLNGFNGDKKAILKPPRKSRDLLNAWAREYVAPKMAQDDSLQKVLSRIGNSAEQLYCIVLGICQIDDLVNKREVRDEINIVNLLPLLEYWVDTKIYAIKHFVNTEVDPLYSGVLEVIKKGIAGQYKTNMKQSNIIREYSAFPRGLVGRNVKNNKPLMKRIMANGEGKNISEKIQRLIELMLGDKILDKIEVGEGRKTICYRVIK